MTKEEIIQMAREAGIDAWWDSGNEQRETLQDYLERFAALVASRVAAAAKAEEREACAKVCDELHWPWHMGDNSGPKECADAIRARGQT